MRIQNEKTGGIHDVKNLEFLPLFYLIPYNILKDETELVDMPRNAREAVFSDCWREKICSDRFLLTVQDSAAFYVWATFDINPYIHCFSGNDPIFRIAYMTDVWADAFSDLGVSIRGLLFMSRKEYVPWMDESGAALAFEAIGRYGVNKHNLQPVIDCVKQHRCHEDYDKRMSNPKKDFYRKWNHSRAMTKVVSIEELMKKAGLQFASDEEYYSLVDQVVEYNNLNSEHATIYKMDLERYLNRLEDKDTEILALKYSGYTQNEIAERLGYKTHSAVGKRISGHIRREYHDYFAWEPGLK